MLKKIGGAIVFLGFVGAIVYGYYYLKEVKKPIDATVNCIPPSATLIIELSNPKKAWNKLSSSNIIWEELKITTLFSEIDSTLKTIDSIANNSKIFVSNPLYISCHQSGAKAFDLLYTMHIPKRTTNEEALAFIEKIMQSKTSNKKEYAGVSIKEFEGKKTFIIIHNNTITWSKSMLVIEESIRQINGGKSLLENPSFKKVYETAGQKTDANIFINHKTITDIANTFCNETTLKDVKQLSSYGNWSELDLKVKPNALMFNGYTHSNDSAKNYLNAFKGQSPQEIEAIDVLPTNTAALVALGFSNFTSFHKQYQTQTGNENKLFEYKKYIQEVEEKFNINCQQNILGWIDNEMGVFTTELNEISTKTENNYAYLKAIDADRAIKNLQELSEQTAESERDSITVIYRENAIKRINISGVLEALLGNLFTGVQNNFYTSLGDYIIFGNSVKAMRDLINSYLQEKTLGKDIYYNEFTENIASKSNIYVYNNIARSPYLYSSWLTDDKSKDIEEKEELLRKFQAIAVQVSYDKSNMYYNNIYLRHNPVYKQGTATLWELALDAPFSRTPELFDNHNTGAKDIFIQDENNTIYLISNTGKVHWKKELAEPIIGGIKQVDALKNNKFQLLFNTASAIYLLDRNGNNVFNFPVKLKEKATNPITVMDYDNNRNYRLLIALADNKVYNYNIEGAKIEGWVMEPSKANIKQPLQHFIVNSKDYIVAIDENGNTYVVNRKGEMRVNIPNKLPTVNNQKFYIEKAKEINNCKIVSVDSLGQIIKLSFAGNVDTTSTLETKKGYSFAYQDINTDAKADVIYHTANMIKVMEQDGNQLFEFELEENIEHNPLLFKLPDNTWRVGLVAEGSNQLYLFNEVGVIAAGFPLYGATTFTIGDINKDGSLNLITGNRANKVYTYNLE